MKHFYLDPKGNWLERTKRRLQGEGIGRPKKQNGNLPTKLVFKQLSGQELIVLPDFSNGALHFLFVLVQQLLLLDVLLASLHFPSTIEAAEQ